jgi:hypothetical protein
MPGWLAWLLVGVGCVIAVIVIVLLAAVVFVFKAIAWLVSLVMRRRPAGAVHVDLALALHEAGRPAPQPRHRLTDAEVLAAYELEVVDIQLDDSYLDQGDFS